jgi:biotin carboxyl carrier protein
MASRRAGSDHLPPGRHAQRRTGQAARRSRRTGEIRRGRADLCHVPRPRPHLPARTRQRLADAGTPAAAGSQAGHRLPGGVRTRANSTSRCMARPITSASRAPARAAMVSDPSMSMSMASPRKCCWKPWMKSKSRPGSNAPRTGTGKKADSRAVRKQRPRPTHAGCVTTAMPGAIVDVKVKVGDKIKAGDGVLVIEAMKMENEVQAPVPAPSSPFTSPRAIRSRRTRCWWRFSRKPDA